MFVYTKVLYEHLYIFQVLFILSIVEYQPISLNSYEYPGWASVIGWLVTCSSIIPIPIYMIYKFIVSKGTVRMVSSFEILRFLLAYMYPSKHNNGLIY